jgi:hypothetical protein
MAFNERDLYRLIYLPEAIKGSGALEVKITKTDSLPFSSVKEKQREFLLQCQKRLLYKNEDYRLGIATSGKSDMTFLVGGKGYVGVCFWKPRKLKILYWITINDFLEAEKTCGRKSLTEDLASAIAAITQVL